MRKAACRKRGSEWRMIQIGVVRACKDETPQAEARASWSTGTHCVWIERVQWTTKFPSGISASWLGVGNAALGFEHHALDGF